MSINKKNLAIYGLTLALSCITYGIIIGFYGFVYSNFEPWMLITIFIIPLYAFIPYTIFAVPLQILLRKKVKKFSVQYLLIYIVVALIALFLFSLASDPSYVLSEVKHVSFYYLSFVAAAVYWFWDSVFIKNQIK
ncbi:UPF0715 family protein [Bacillus mojavensis]|uniref:UPF0715 family protein n=1 Tax=Bacillus TaxID=1386 RepID=UPI001E4A506C|nr:MULTISPECIES: UPF0715 family protein [Bacillus]MCC2928907.1 UPF0715 family protein [Bacillus sp. LBG-1-113]MCY8107013.1 UPF0715 family protein [Bacillus mojavensis]MCY8480690.1 UPF0715 family protein [Bacillus mojavensis]MCY9191135.1 UPF0715 family protein [Bacillus mojavensis]MEC1625872.1 UPF0715 family protein [Bacillus mojavensis]